MPLEKVENIQGDFFHWYPPTPPPPQKFQVQKVSRPIYVNVDSPNLGFTYFNFLVKKITLYNHHLCIW